MIVALAVPFAAAVVAITGAVAIIVGIVVANWSPRRSTSSPPRGLRSLRGVDLREPAVVRPHAKSGLRGERPSRTARPRARERWSAPRRTRCCRDSPGRSRNVSKTALGFAAITRATFRSVDPSGHLLTQRFGWRFVSAIRVRTSYKSHASRPAKITHARDPHPRRRCRTLHLGGDPACDAWYLVVRPAFTSSKSGCPPAQPNPAPPRPRPPVSLCPRRRTHADRRATIPHIQPHEGLEITYREVHQAINRDAPVRFLVTSRPGLATASNLPKNCPAGQPSRSVVIEKELILCFISQTMKYLAK